MAAEPATSTSCPHCGGTSLVAGVEISMTAESGSVGPSYKTGLILRGTEPLVADLCPACGTVARLYVKNTDRQWVLG